MASLALENTTAVSSGYSTAVPAVPSLSPTFLGLSAQANSTYIVPPDEGGRKYSISQVAFRRSVQEEVENVPVKMCGEHGECSSGLSGGP